MRILIIDNSALFCKKGYYYTNSLNGILVNELIDCGHNLTYFQFATTSRTKISDYALAGKGLSCRPLKLYRNKLLRYVYAYFMAIFAILKADFIYIYYPTSFKYVPFLCRLLGRPYGLYIRGMNGLDDKISHINYKHAFTIFTVSDLFTRKVNNICGTEKAHTIRPMIPYTDADVVHDREYHPKQKYDMLYLGRIAKDKGLSELLQAAVLLREKNGSFHLKIVGNGEYMEELKELHSRLALSGYVSIEGAVTDDEKKKKYYLDADLYILPTYHEGFPRTLYEAMIFGTPILTTFVGGIPALMVDGENARRIEPRSAQSIAEGMEYAMSHYQEMGKMARNGAELVGKVVNRNRLTHAQHLNEILKNGK